MFAHSQRYGIRVTPSFMPRGHRMGNLRFLLSNPEHHIYTDHEGVLREDLVFNAPTIDKECGDILISREYHNNQHDGKFSTHWETTNVAPEDYHAKKVIIWHRTDALDCKINKWNEQSPEDKWTDQIQIDWLPSLKVYLTLPSEQFSRLLQINWKEQFLNLAVDTNQSLNGLKIPLAEEDKNAYREGKQSFQTPDNHIVTISRYRIEIKSTPECTRKVSDESSRLNVLSRLLRFALGR